MVWALLGACVVVQNGDQDARYLRIYSVLETIKTGQKFFDPGHVKFDVF